MTGWPDLPDKTPEIQKILYQAQVEEAKALRRDPVDHGTKKSERDQDRGWATADRAEDRGWAIADRSWGYQQGALAAEYALAKSVHDARVEVARDALTRSQAGAEFVRNAAAGIVTVYTLVIGASFAADKDHPMPASGLVPALFLGLALVCATAYMAWLGRPPAMAAPIPHTSLPIYQDRRVNSFVTWVSGLALSRAAFLHASVFALGIGVLMLPIPFLALDAKTIGVPVLGDVPVPMFLSVLGVLVVLIGPPLARRLDNQS